jgi:phosphoserine phosphatase
MTDYSIRRLLAGALLLTVSVASAGELDSWVAGPARKAIVDFVRQSTRTGTPAYIAPADRIAVFDMDGTLLVEQPMYFAFQFALDTLNRGASGLSIQQLSSLQYEAQGGIDPQAAGQKASQWLKSAKHPRFQRTYGELTYRPQKELIAYLKRRGFTVYICSGSGQEFIRAVEGLSIDRTRVIGSTVKSEYKDGQVTRSAVPEFFNNGPNKAIAIERAIGGRPVLAFGNSDGDLEMLEFTTTGGRGLGLILHHDDGDREYAYDRGSNIGGLEKALDQAGSKGWVVVSMKRDWKRVF